MTFVSQTLKQRGDGIVVSGNLVRLNFITPEHVSGKRHRRIAQ